jgi:cell division protein FtsW (lipid II flippase)
MQNPPTVNRNLTLSPQFLEAHLWLASKSSLPGSGSKLSIQRAGGLGQGNSLGFVSGKIYVTSGITSAISHSLGVCVCVCVCVCVLGIEPRALRIAGENPTAEPHPQPT